MFSPQISSSSQKRRFSDCEDENFKSPSKRFVVYENTPQTTPNCLQNHFPNPFQMDLDVINQFIWKLWDPVIFQKCCRVADVYLPLRHTHDFSPQPPVSPNYNHISITEETVKQVNEGMY